MNRRGFLGMLAALVPIGLLLKRQPAPVIDGEFCAVTVRYTTPSGRHTEIHFPRCRLGTPPLTVYPDCTDLSHEWTRGNTVIETWREPAAAP